jgi:hypothetical protein
MPTDAEQIATIKSQTLQLIVDLTTDPKPSYNIDGQNILWGDYLNKLRQTVAWCDEQLAATQGPYEFETRGTT